MLDGIDKDGKKTKDILDMIRQDDIVFKKENIGLYMLFHNNILTHIYYAAKYFVNLINIQEVKGLKFQLFGKI